MMMRSSNNNNTPSLHQNLPQGTLMNKNVWFNLNIEQGLTISDFRSFFFLVKKPTSLRNILIHAKKQGFVAS